MPETQWLQRSSPAFRLMMATSWLAPDSWKENQEKAIRKAIEAEPDWTEYLSLVDRHRTPALSWAALRRVPGIMIPEPAAQELQKRSDACRRQAIKHCLLLTQLLKVFNNAGIPVMILKGPVLSDQLYGDVGLRQSKDIDLAVELADLSRAQTCLSSLGWNLDPSWFPLSPRQWASFLRNEHELQFIDPGGGAVLEIHWRNDWDTPIQYNACWARSISSVWQGCNYQALDPIDQLLYLCNHGGIHAWSRVKWLGDLARIHSSGQVDWQAAVDRARNTGQENPLLASLKLLQIVYGLPLPGLLPNPWKDLPSFLVDSPLHEILVLKDSATLGPLEMFRSRLRLTRYQKLALPRKAWRESLARFTYNRKDFKALRLPDVFFWAYAPLHPVLSVWRKIMRLWAH
jgi:hypothetical protein